jgi:hypothetical protein
MARYMHLAERIVRRWRERMNETDQQLVKKIIGRITDLDPKWSGSDGEKSRFFLEASLPAEYMKDQWMRQVFQILDRETEDRYQMAMLVTIVKIDREDQMLAHPTLHDLMALVEQQNGS